MIKSVKIEVKGQEFDLTMEEAKKLCNELLELFPNTREIEIIKTIPSPQWPSKQYWNDWQPPVIVT